jgi:hypothetical protein
MDQRVVHSVCQPMFHTPLSSQSYKMVSGTLSLTLNGVTETYNFRYPSTVPEAAGLLLHGTGLLGIVWRQFRATRH